jgi:aldose 1-epimerase
MMQCLTNQPGIQFYSGNFLSGETGKSGAVYNKRSGLCLETQNWPDAVNRCVFPDSILRKGEIYSHKTVYALRVVS